MGEGGREGEGGLRGFAQVLRQLQAHLDSSRGPGILQEGALTVLHRGAILCRVILQLKVVD